MGRRGLVILVSTVMALGTFRTAGATQPIRFTEHALDLNCPDPIVDVGGTDVAAVFASFSDQFGAAGDAAFWSGTTVPAGAPDLETDFSALPTGTGTASSISVSIPLVTVATGLPDGTATVAATFAPAGDPVTFDFRDRFGNSWSRGTETDQPMTVAGTLTIGGASFSLDGCAGLGRTVVLFATQPHATVFDIDHTIFFCEPSTPAADVFMFAEVGEGFQDLSVGVSNPPRFGDTADFTLDRTTFSGTVPLFDETTGDPAGDAVVDATVTPGDPIRVKLTRHLNREFATETPLAIDGTLTVPGIVDPIDLSSCVAYEDSRQVAFTPSNGPKPIAIQPGNDAPDGAIGLEPGSKITTQTRGASLEPEEPASCAPFGRTLWYTIEGTGGDVTIDTVGSNFDTVLAVYTDGGSFTDVACNDDVLLPGDFVQATVQAALTFGTVSGVTYYVQVGGFDYRPDFDVEFGLLHLAVT